MSLFWLGRVADKLDDLGALQARRIDRGSRVIRPTGLREIPAVTRTRNSPQKNEDTTCSGQYRCSKPGPMLEIRQGQRHHAYRDGDADGRAP